jgi:hypothetical protein
MSESKGKEAVGKIVILLREKGIKKVDITGKVSPSIIPSLRFHIQRAYRKYQQERAMEGRRLKEERDRKKVLEQREAEEKAERIEREKRKAEQEPSGSTGSAQSQMGGNVATGSK